MTATVKYDEVEAGQEIQPVDYRVRRVDLVMYAGASGDFNQIHWNERFAKMVGLPDVIAHGMYTMAQAGRFVTDWACGSRRWWSCRTTTRAPRSR